MAARIPVLLEKTPYEVIVGNGILARTGEFILPVLKPRKCAIVTDENVGPLYAGIVEQSLANAGFTPTRIVVPAGEKSKSLGVVEEVADQMIAAGLDRSSMVAGLGGGVVGDLSGFVAAVFFRGIPHVQIPTTVIAQVDSSVGGKTGVNSRLGKNLIGSFHQPSLVIVDPATLRSLPKREFNEGFAEIIKHAAIRSAPLLDETLHFQDNDLSSLIAQNIKIKARIVSEDEFETKDLRALLNFGHTIGHAIENCAGYGRYLHGEAISIGLAGAVALSKKKASLSEAEGDRILDALRAFDLPVTIPNDLPTDRIMEALGRDKKFVNGAIRFVVVPMLGKAVVSQTINRDDIREAIEGLREKSA